MRMFEELINPTVDFSSDGNIDTECDIGPMPWGDGVVEKRDLKA